MRRTGNACRRGPVAGFIPKDRLDGAALRSLVGEALR